MGNNNRLGTFRISIIGLGLMGGSLARAIRPYVANITAVDPNQNSLNAALHEGVIDRGTADLSDGITGADILILAAPVRTVLTILEQLPTFCPEGCLVLDLGSTKREICAAMDRLPAVFEAIGGHPMCGKESSGFAQADPALYADKTFILCRTERTTTAVEQAALGIVEAVKGRPLFLPPPLHDELVSVTSHLPYLISSVLMRRAAELAEEEEDLWRVSASGFRDSSRLSGSSPAVMADILLTNRTAVLKQLHRYRALLDELTALMESEPDEALVHWLETVQRSYQDYRKFVDQANE